MIFIGLDDTDTPESRGTGHLARQIAGALAGEHRVLGVTRHQLLVDPRVPCTKNNSCAAIILDDDGDLNPTALLHTVQTLMLEDYCPGSDPGLCVAHDVPAAITEFGRRTQRHLITQAEGRALAKAHGIPLVGLGGSQDGIIGALAAVGLAASGEDGRYVQVGRARGLSGLQPVAALLEAGIAAVQTADGRPVLEGMVQTDRLRPARRSGLPVAILAWAEGYWTPLKLD